MIHFGTGGWRAIIADEFTKENTRLVTAGLLSYRDHYETGFHDLLSRKSRKQHRGLAMSLR